MSTEIKPCPKCNLPVDPVENPSGLHDSYCVGETPYVMHNRKAGMVVYLTEEEWAAMVENSQRMEAGGPDDYPAGMATAIANRAVFGIKDYGDD